MTEVLQTTNLTKRFGAVTALHHVNLTVNEGEIVALLGDNGAGKSTMMSLIGGSMAADEGTVTVDGREMKSLADAKELGVGVVYQDLALAQHLTVADNMFLGNEITKGLFRRVDRKAMAVASREAVERLGISTLHDVGMSVSKLSGGQRQVLAVARAMNWAKRIILLDEPTAALGPKQVGIVLDAIRTAADHGLGVILVSHDIPNVLRLADRLVILRHGTIADDAAPQGRTVADVVTTMVGEE